MQSDTLLHAANFSTLFVCFVLKFPQIFVLMRAKSTTGVSLNSLLLELVGYVFFGIEVFLTDVDVCYLTAKWRREVHCEQCDCRC